MKTNWTYEMRKAHDYLSEIKNLAYKVDAINEALSELKTRNPANLKATQYDAIKVQTSGGDPLANYVIAESQYKTDLLVVKTAYSKAQKDAIKRITRLDNGMSIEILTRRYILCQPWETIASELYCDKRWLQRLRNRALAEFYNANTDLWPKIQ